MRENEIRASTKEALEVSTVLPLNLGGGEVAAICCHYYLYLACMLKHSSECV